MSQEQLVVIASAVFSLGDPRESVQVQLALEGGQLRLLEILRHNRVDELLRLVKDETSAMRLPRERGEG